MFYSTVVVSSTRMVFQLQVRPPLLTSTTTAPRHPTTPGLSSIGSRSRIRSPCTETPTCPTLLASQGGTADSASLFTSRHLQVWAVCRHSANLVSTSGTMDLVIILIIVILTTCILHFYILCECIVGTRENSNCYILHSMFLRTMLWKKTIFSVILMSLQNVIGWCPFYTTKYWLISVL